jgi:hypothetical protein
VDVRQVIPIRVSFQTVQAELVEALRPGFDKLSPNGFLSFPTRIGINSARVDGPLLKRSRGILKAAAQAGRSAP